MAGLWLGRCVFVSTQVFSGAALPHGLHRLLGFLVGVAELHQRAWSMANALGVPLQWLAICGASLCCLFM